MTDERMTAAIAEAHDRDEQDRLDGLALRRLREALPLHLIRIGEWETMHGDTVVSVSTESPAVYRQRRERHYGDGQTIAEAANACRESLP